MITPIYVDLRLVISHPVLMVGFDECKRAKRLHFKYIVNQPENQIKGTFNARLRPFVITSAHERFLLKGL